MVARAAFAIGIIIAVANATMLERKLRPGKRHTDAIPLLCSGADLHGQGEPGRADARLRDRKFTCDAEFSTARARAALLPDNLYANRSMENFESAPCSTAGGPSLLILQVDALASAPSMLRPVYGVGTALVSYHLPLVYAVLAMPPSSHTRAAAGSSSSSATPSSSISGGMSNFFRRMVGAPAQMETGV